MVGGGPDLASPVEGARRPLEKKEERESVQLIRALIARGWGRREGDLAPHRYLPGFTRGPKLPAGRRNR